MAGRSSSPLALATNAPPILRLRDVDLGHRFASAGQIGDVEIGPSRRERHPAGGEMLAEYRFGVRQRPPRASYAVNDTAQATSAAVRLRKLFRITASRYPVAVAHNRLALVRVQPAPPDCPHVRVRQNAASKPRGYVTRERAGGGVRRRMTRARSCIRVRTAPSAHHRIAGRLDRAAPGQHGSAVHR